jgi:hypothetical protein
VVLEFVRLRQTGGHEEEHAHRVAAIIGVAEAAARSGWAVDEGRISPDLLVGRRLSLDQFYGPLFDPATGTLRPARTVGHGAHFIDDRGFVDALLEPPYGLHPATDGAFTRALDPGELLRDVIRHVLDAPTVDTPIWHWNGDWCRYFDAGRDWWGASAWTVRTGPAEMIALAASATD